MEKPGRQYNFRVVSFEEFPVCEGLVLPGFPELMINGEKKITSIRDFKSQDTEIMINCFPKSGTHWINEIVEQLIAGKGEYSSREMFFIELDSVQEFEAKRSSRPRCIITHLPFHMLPRRHIELNAKIIRVIRNPKDVAVSYFHHCQKDPTAGAITMPWSEFLEKYTLNNIIPYCSWFDYEKKWEQVLKDHPNLNIITIYYEDMKQNLENEIKKIAEFIQVGYTDDLIKQITEKVDFRNMSILKYDYSHMFSVEEKSFIYRKGEVGDWKNWFTVAQNEWFDALYETEMKDSNLKNQIKFTL